MAKQATPCSTLKGYRVRSDGTVESCVPRGRFTEGGSADR